MDGLKQKYSQEVTFYDLDATSAEGQAKMRELGLIYHGYAVVDRWGEVYWLSSGHAFTPQQLEQKISEALAVPPPG